MPTYIGFSTANLDQTQADVVARIDGGVGSLNKQIQIGKKYRLVDDQLIIQDFLNALSIKQGEKVGQPGYGTLLWSYVFEPNTSDVRGQIEAEILKIATSDPRLTVGNIDVFEHSSGVLIELEIAIKPYNNVVQIGFLLNRYDGSIQRLAQ
jgi:phage baseplate assembly protein W